ncbi:MAG: small basic protein [Candidatus Omnitrophica bacterium]|nr:small basic protein [Candidatus Omnitrophota bacterium]
MTQHPSLKSGAKGAKFRSVPKRYEKVKELSEKDKWDAEKDSVYRLPKVKRVLFKTKKTKGPVEEAAAEGAPGAAEEAAPAAKKSNK